MNGFLKSMVILIVTGIVSYIATILIAEVFEANRTEFLILWSANWILLQMRSIYQEVVDRRN
jgi:CHASE3 domain sensor protein